jgi:hypothetical protein
MTITFGTEPTGPPPSSDEPWLWIGDQWVLVATDTDDDVPPTLDDLDEAKAEAAMSDVTIPRAVPLKNLPDVELVAVGQWPARTGPITVTGDDLRQALTAVECPAVGNPVLKLGHDEPEPVDGVRWDGEPAVGWVSNLRLSGNKAKLLGDYRGVPGWLADVMPSAYPRRSVEIKKGWQCQIGHTHPFVITGVALLGVNPPAVGVIRSLHDVQALYTMAAAGGDPPPEVVRSIEITLGASAMAGTGADRGAGGRPAGVRHRDPPSVGIRPPPAAGPAGQVDPGRAGLHPQPARPGQQRRGRRARLGGDDRRGVHRPHCDDRGQDRRGAEVREGHRRGVRRRRGPGCVVRRAGEGPQRDRQRPVPAGSRRGAQ